MTWKCIKYGLFAFIPLAALITHGEGSPPATDFKFFEERVRPVLEARCYECHSHQSGKMKSGLALDSRSGWATGGDSGPALVPGDPGKSLIIKAIHHTDPDLKMPPKAKLPEAEIAVLEEWVKMGAPDPRVTNVSSKPDDDWWSLKPLHRPPLPKSGMHPIDAFISAGLEQQSIQPVGEASRRTLIRRLTLDLHGLLPTPVEVDSFLSDPDPQAYEKLVSRLLASPRYGERWARHWLDAIHFADTHGFEHDLMRTNAWRYRDYVIESLNRDVPWSRFVREQLAADVFLPDEPKLTAALGFIGAGPWDQSTAQTAPKTFEYLDRDDIVTQTMSTLVSSTVHCARCHDHKFDPISQEDYYSLQAVFAGVGKGDVAYDEDLARHRERRAWKDLITAAEARDRQVLLTPENQGRVAAWEASHAKDGEWHTLTPDVFVTASPAALNRLEDGSLMATGSRPDTDTYTITAAPRLREITAIRLEVLADASLPMKGPGRADNGNFHLSEFQVQMFPPAAVQGERVKIRRATANFNQSGWTISHAIDGNDKSAWGIHPQQGESHLAVFELDKTLLLVEGARLVIQLKQVHGQGHVIGKFRLSITGDDPAYVSVLPTEVAEIRRVPLAQRSEEQRLVLNAFLLRQIAEEQLKRMPPALQVFGAAPVFTAVSEGMSYKPWREPKQVHVLGRGDIEKPGAAAVPGALAAITQLSGRFDLKENDEGGRRAALADWIASADNPLTWRSVVNRIWHHHFGRGLSDTLNDFGRMGSPPSHPELLDWLACEFRDDGGSLKRLHYLIVTSAAYRRAAQHDEMAAARDPDNVLLWRRQSVRLDAEAYRDSVMAIAGRLDLALGGPAVQQFKLGKPIQLTPTVDYGPYDWNSPGAGRRSIYRFIYRGLPDPFLDALDFPDAAQLAPSRPFSASPLQSLALLNDDFVLHHSAEWAKRLERSCDGSEDRVREAFRLAFQREPMQDEAASFAGYASKHGWAAMCRLLLNSNEFLFVN